MIPKRHKTTTMDTVLHQLRLPQYNSAFQKHHIDFPSFLRINDQALKTIGVQNESHRQRIVMCSRKMHEVVCRTIAEEPLVTGVPPCDASSTPARDNGATISTDDYEKSPLWDDPELLERVMSGGGLERQPLTPITEESSASAEPSELDQELDGSAAVPSKSHDRGTKRRHASTVTSVRSIDSIDEEPDVSLLGAPTAAVPTNSASSLMPRSLRRSLDEATLARRRQRAAERDPTWRSSMPVFSQSVQDVDTISPPSYKDAMLTKILTPKPLDYDEIGKEELPSYTCTVQRVGYVLRKCERTSHNSKARDRAWRRNYLYLWGTLLRIYKSEPVDVKRISPSYELSMRNARVTLATDYTKRRHVLRVTFDTTGHQFLFQAAGRDDCIGWIEHLQSAANISPTIDELEMPLFITLTTRRRRMMFGTGYFADMARDLQQLPLPAAEPISVGNRMR